MGGVWRHAHPASLNGFGRIHTVTDSDMVLLHWLQGTCMHMHVYAGTQLRNDVICLALLSSQRPTYYIHYFLNTGYFSCFSRALPSA